MKGLEPTESESALDFYRRCIPTLSPEHQAELLGAWAAAYGKTEPNDFAETWFLCGWFLARDWLEYGDPRDP